MEDYSNTTPHFHVVFIVVARCPWSDRRFQGVSTRRRCTVDAEPPRWVRDHVPGLSQRCCHAVWMTDGWSVLLGHQCYIDMHLRMERKGYMPMLQMIDGWSVLLGHRCMGRKGNVGLHAYALYFSTSPLTSIPCITKT